MAAACSLKALTRESLQIVRIRLTPPEVPFGGLELLLDTGGIVATQIGMRLAFETSRLGLRAIFPLTGVAAARRHHTIIMIGMLKISFGGYAITRCRRVPCER